MNRPNRSRDGQAGRGSQSKRSDAPAGRRQDSNNAGGERRNSPAGGNNRFSGRSFSDRNTNEGGDNRPPRGERPARPFNADRPQRTFNSDRPSGEGRPQRPTYGSRVDRPRDDRTRGERPQRPGFGNRDDRPRDDRPRNDRPQRPAFGSRDEHPRNDRPTGDRPQRPSFGSRDDRPRGEGRPQRPAFGSREDRPRDDRPRGEGRPQRPPFGNRDDRPQRPSFGSRDDRPRNDGPRGEGRPQRPAFGNRDDRPRGDRPQRPAFGPRDDRPRDDRPRFNSGDDRPRRDDRPRGDRPQRPAFGPRDDRPRDDRPRDDRPRFNSGDDRPRRDDQQDRPRPERTEGDRPKRIFESREQQRPRRNDDRASSTWAGSSRTRDTPQRPSRGSKGGDGIDRSFAPTGPKTENSFTGNAVRRTQEKIQKNMDRANLDRKQDKEDDAVGDIRLNRFIANAGVCSRREADKLIAEGRITVNGKIQAEMGYRVQKDDQVRLGSKLLSPEKNVYVLINKPKDYITTKDDEEGRRTVMDLLGKQIQERIYPVGRLDRNTTGLLILTNDGELADKLMHPSFEIKKVYQVDLDRPLSDEDFNTIKRGIELEDGPAKVDDMAVLSPDRKSIGLEIHIGRNRIVRRIFEALEYTVVKLDRVMYGGITKKDLPRGKWRFLTQEEILNLKHYA